MSVNPAEIALSPFDDEQSTRLNAAFQGLNRDQLNWVSGYAAGLAATSLAASANEAATPASASDPAVTLTILYGSQTGNGEGVAQALASRAREQGFAVRLESLADFRPSALKRETLVTFIVSTHGEGDPPDDAELFREFLLSQKAPSLPKLRYSVLALGDSSYVNFCQTGREFDERLAELGAERIVPTVECDVDYESAAEGWADSILAVLPGLVDANTGVKHLRAIEPMSAPQPVFGKHRPFSAEILVNQKITGRGSTKDVRHIELSLEDSGLTYEPGDALAVIAHNPPALVRQFTEALDLDPAAIVTVDDEAVELELALTRLKEITAVNVPFLRSWAALVEEARRHEIEALLEDSAALGELVDSHQVIDVVRRFPATVGAQAFVDSLRRLPPRSYSIASSPVANPDEVHLTVAAVRYEAFGSEHWGAASTYLADRLDEGQSVDVYVEPNARFRLPADDSAPVIMIGPGTGVAPFRAFVEERAERGAAGRNWLIFGERNFASDFLYQLEWHRHLKQGNLERLDVAFSRDQEAKVYVQDRIRENGEELYRWLEDGAYLYVCGDAQRMAPDVDAALAEVIAAHAGTDLDAATSRLKELRRSGRYQRDVY